MRKTVIKTRLTESSAKADLAYWLSRPPEERVGAVELLRKETYGGPARLQRVARVIKQAKG